MYEYRGTVKQITDGDTMVIEVDLGFRTYTTFKFRLFGINTPEVIGKEKAKGLASKKFVEDRINLNEVVRIETFKDRQEKYGRYLANIYYINLDGDEVQLNKELVDNKMATAYFGEGEKL